MPLTSTPMRLGDLRGRMRVGEQSIMLLSSCPPTLTLSGMTFHDRPTGINNDLSLR